MPTRTRGPDDIRAQFGEQWRFLRRSCDAYDSGDEAEAKRMAATLRLLLHDTRRSRALLTLLSSKDILFIDTAEDVNPENLLPTFGLVLARLGGGVARYVAPLGAPLPKPIWLIPFQYWWDKSVICVPGDFTISRKYLVLAMADQDGGAHVDPELDELYYRLTREHALNAVYSVGGITYPIPHIATASVRQIAHEVLATLVKPYRMIPPDLPDAQLEPVVGATLDAATGQVTSTSTVPRHMCMCHSGLEYKDCHARGGVNEGKTVAPLSSPASGGGRP